MPFVLTESPDKWQTDRTQAGWWASLFIWLVSPFHVTHLNCILTCLNGSQTPGKRTQVFRENRNKSVTQMVLCLFFWPGDFPEVTLSFPLPALHHVKWDRSRVETVHILDASQCASWWNHTCYRVRPPRVEPQQQAAGSRPRFLNVDSLYLRPAVAPFSQRSRLISGEDLHNQKERPFQMLLLLYFVSGVIVWKCFDEV